MEVSKCWKIVKFPAISNKMKNYKTSYETQTGSRLKELIQPSRTHLLPISPDKMLPRLWNKNSYGHIQISEGICFQSAFRMQILDVKKWWGANVFSDTKKKHVCRKICKMIKVFGCAAGAYHFECQVSWGWWNEWHFLSKMYCKISDLFR